MRRFLLTLCVGGSMLTACDSTEVDDPPPGATTFTLTAAGGTFDGAGPLVGVQLVVPPGAVDAAMTLWMAPPQAERPLPEEGRMVGPEVSFGPIEVALAAPAELTLPFESGRVAEAGVELGFVKVWRIGPSGWTIEDAVTPPDAERVTARVERLNRFGAGVELE